MLYDVGSTLITTQQESEKIKSMILDKNFYNVSDSELKILQRVRLGITIITTRQSFKKMFLKGMILKKTFFNKARL